MKKTILLAILGLAIAALAQAAAPKGYRVTDPANRTLQHLSPNPSASSCTTTTTTKGAIATVNVAGYSQLCWEASDSSNAAKRIKRHLNSNTSYMPGTGGCLGLNSGMQTVTFKPYSGAGAAYTVCTEMEKGGKTP